MYPCCTFRVRRNDRIKEHRIWAARIAVAVAVTLAVFRVGHGDDDTGPYVARFSKRTHIEIQESTRLLDLNDDFTIEVWVKWIYPGRFECIAGDEAWPEMSPRIKVDSPCGWILRKRLKDKQEVLEFNVGAEGKNWLNVGGLLPKSAIPGIWQHVAVCRRGTIITLYLNGRRLAAKSVRNLTLLTSPTPIFLGVREDAHPDRQFEGFVRQFHIANHARYLQSFKPDSEFKADGDHSLVLFTFDSPEDNLITDSSGKGHHGYAWGIDIIPLVGR